MTASIKHSFVNAKPDGGDTSIVRPSDWNADHAITGVLDVINGGSGDPGTFEGMVFAQFTDNYRAADPGTHYVAPDAPTVFTRQQNFSATQIYSSSGILVWDPDVAQSAKITLTEDTFVVNPNNLQDGGTYILRVKQSNVTPCILTFDSSFIMTDIPAISAVADYNALFTFYCDEGFLLGNMKQYPAYGGA